VKQGEDKVSGLVDLTLSKDFQFKQRLCRKKTLFK